MPFDDEITFGKNLPVRDHSNVGKGTESRMIGRVGGADTIRKDYCTEPDGTVTMLVTRSGFPEFISKTSPEGATNRTFVFNRLGEKTGVVANRSGGGLKAIGSVKVGTTCGYSICSNVVHHPKKWFDIARLGDEKIAYNGVAMGCLHEVEFLRSRPPLFFAVKSGPSAVANTLEEKWEVAAFNRSGGIINSVTSDDSGGFRSDYSAGPSADPNGVFTFYWATVPGVDTYTWRHRTVKLTSEGVTAVAGQSGTVNTKVSPEVTGSTTANTYSYTYSRPKYTRNAVSGYVDIVVDEYTYSRPVLRSYSDGATLLYGEHSVSFEDKLVSATKVVTMYDQTPVQITLNANLYGSENSTNTYNTGSAQSLPIKVQRDVNYRNTQCTVTLSTVFGPPLFSYRFTNDLTTDKPNPPHPNIFFTTPSDGEYVYPYSTYDIGYGEWCYLHETPASREHCFSTLARQNAYRTEQLTLHVAQFNAMNINAIVGGPFKEGFLDNSPSHYYDTTTVSISSRDYVYADIGEDVFIYLEITAERTIYIEDLKQTLAMLAGGNAAADIDTCTLIAKLVLSFRGEKYTFGEVGPVDTHPAPIAPNPGGTMDYVFSQIPRVPSVTPVFCPPYTQQGNCPYIAYTTKAEEVAGAVPEVYVDFSILPVFQTFEDSEGVVQFPAIQASLAYGLMSQTPDAWKNALFPKPIRVQFCNGTEGPWQEKIGDAFESGANVEISRI